MTDRAQAFSSPELATLSAMAHGRDANPERAAEIGLVALDVAETLDEDRSRIYGDLIRDALSEAARAALGKMDARKYEYRSDFARECIARGHAEGEIQGRAALVLRLLTSRFGALESHAVERIQHASISELEMIGERLLNAPTLQDALR